MINRFDKGKFNNALDSVEVIIPNSKQVRRKFSEFVPLIVSIITVINLIFISSYCMDFMEKYKFQ